MALCTLWQYAQSYVDRAAAHAAAAASFANLSRVVERGVVRQRKHEDAVAVSDYIPYATFYDLLQRREEALDRISPAAPP